MRIDCAYNDGNDYYFLRINNKFQISDMISELSIDEGEYISILKKYGAILLIQEEYFFTSYDAALACMNSEELMPYLMMMEVSK